MRLLPVVLLSAALAGCSVPNPTALPTAGSESSVAASATPPSALSLPSPQPRPVRISIPTVDVDGEVMIDGLGVDANGGHAEPPVEQPKLASWYNLGPRPGERGPSVILGHVNGRGQQGIFASLHRAQLGDRVFVEREDGTEAVFEIYRVDQEVLKTNFPKEEVYGETAGAELRLITCGGELDREAHHYLHNVLVFARLVS